MTKNNILKIEIVLKEYGLTNLGIVIFNNRFLKKYEIAMLIGPDEPFFWDIFKKSKAQRCFILNYISMYMIETKNGANIYEKSI